MTPRQAWLERQALCGLSEAAKNELTKERVAELMAEGAPLRKAVEDMVDGRRAEAANDAEW